MSSRSASSATGTTVTAKPYLGRFAPSPTGPLHFGSLLAAVASYLQARRNNGRWLLRIEDIDPPREQAGAAEAIIACLEAYGFEWDGPVLWQSNSRDAHAAAIAHLQQQGLVYACGCSRRDLADAPRGPLGIVYPGTCRLGCEADETALRLRCTDVPVTFIDGLQGPQTQRLQSESGDFVVLRRDGLIAYHLAVVVDDADQQVTEIVRGIDLMDSTPRQIYLQQQLGCATPAYCHIPVASHADGQKLSKLTGAPGLPLRGKAAILLAALEALQQAPPPNLRGATLEEIWAWASEHWQINALQSQTAVLAPAAAMAGSENPLL